MGSAEPCGAEVSPARSACIFMKSAEPCGADGSPARNAPAFTPFILSITSPENCIFSFFSVDAFSSLARISSAMKTLKSIVPVSLLALIPSAWAAANTDAVAIATDVQDTFQAVLPVGLGILGTLMAIGILTAALRARRRVL